MLDIPVALLSILTPIVIGASYWAASEHGVDTIRERFYDDVITEEDGRFVAETKIRRFTGSVITYAILTQIVVSLVQTFGRDRTIASRDSEIETLRVRLDASEHERGAHLQDIQSLIAAYLLELARGPLNFRQTGDHDDRISIYRHTSDGHFQCVGRFSFNQKFDKLSDRPYRDDCGVIQKAWENGWHYESYDETQSIDTKSYRDWQSGFGYSDEEINSMRMKSCLYCGSHVLDTKRAKKIAVVIVESTDPQRHTEDSLREALEGNQSRYTSELVETLVSRMTALLEEPQ